MLVAIEDEHDEQDADADQEERHDFVDGFR